MVATSDLVTDLFNRLGNLGLLLIASALLLGGLAGAAVVHRYDGLTADTIAARHPDGRLAPKPQRPHSAHQPPANRGRQNGLRATLPPPPMGGQIDKDP